MHDKARLLDDKGKLIGSGKQTKGNLVYLDLGECSCFITEVEKIWLCCPKEFTLISKGDSKVFSLSNDPFFLTQTD